MHGWRGIRQRFAIKLAWRPEWPIGSIAILAWIALIAWHTPRSPESGVDISLLGSAKAIGGSIHPHATQVDEFGSTAAVAASLAGWAVMAIAMMTPATLPAVRHVGFNSIRSRRLRAMVVYFVSFIAIWVAFGAAALTLITAAKAVALDTVEIALLTLGIATAWQLTKWKRRAVISCRRTVALPPEGWRADVACAHFGTRQGMRCITSYWPAMLLMTVIGHTYLPAMVALGALMVAEEHLAVGPRLIKPLAAALAISVVALALFG
jgi:predicted metal-binding membrane protein